MVNNNSPTSVCAAVKLPVPALVNAPKSNSIFVVPPVSAYGSRVVRHITSSIEQDRHKGICNSSCTAPPAIVCAASAPGLDTIVHGFIAVKNEQHPVRILVDTGATESCVSQQYVERVGASVRSKPEVLTLANGSTATSQGTIVAPVIQ